MSYFSWNDQLKKRLEKNQASQVKYLFTHVDSPHTDKLTYDELEANLKELNIYVTKEELRLYMTRYNLDLYNELNFHSCIHVYQDIKCKTELLPLFQFYCPELNQEPLTYDNALSPKRSFDFSSNSSHVSKLASNVMT